MDKKILHKINSSPNTLPGCSMTLRLPVVSRNGEAGRDSASRPPDFHRPRTTGFMPRMVKQ